MDKKAAIQRYEGTRVARALNWASLNDGEMKRAAAEAASTRELEELWNLTEAFLTLNSTRPVSQYTLRNYKHGLSKLLEHWQGENLLRPSRHASSTFLLKLQEEGLAAGTIQVHLAAAKALYRALRWSGATSAAPFADTRAPVDLTPAEEKRQAYSDDEVLAMLEAAVEPIDTLLVLLGAHGGLRVSEMLALRWHDIHLAAGTLKLTGKGQKVRTVHLSQALVSVLEELNTGQGSDYVLPFRTATRARQRLQILCSAAGVQYLGMHSLRHSCGTRLYRLTNDLRVAAKHLGHASTATTQIYAKMDTRSLEEAINRL